MLAKLAAKFGKQFTYRVARLNGEPAVLEYVSGHVFAATFCETDGERILAMYRVLNPEKLTHVAGPGGKPPGFPDVKKRRNRG